MISYNIIFSILVILLTFAVCTAVEPCTEEARYVTFITQFVEEVQVNSPKYPNNYTTDVECYFAQVGGAFDEPFVFSVVQEVNECSIPYTVVGSNNSQIPNQYETCSREGNIFINNKFILRRQPSRLETLRFNLPAGSISSFTFKVAAYPLLSMEPTSSTVNITTTPTAYITSHQGFPEFFYSRNLHNILTLSDIPSGYGVVIEVIYMTLGTRYQCRTGSGVNDVFRVYRDEEIDPVYECADYIGISTPDPQQISSANSIRLEFMTDSEDFYNGFLLQVHRLPSNSSTSTVTTLYGTSIDGTVGTRVSISTNSPISTASTTSTTSSTSSTSTTSTTSTTNATSITSTTSSTSKSARTTSSTPFVSTPSGSTAHVLSNTSAKDDSGNTVKISVAAGVAVGAAVFGFIVGAALSFVVLRRRFLSSERSTAESKPTEPVEIYPEYDTVFVGASNSGAISEGMSVLSSYIILFLHVYLLMQALFGSYANCVRLVKFFAANAGATNVAAHRYSYVDLPEGVSSVSVNEYMSPNTTSVPSSTEDNKDEETHLYEKLQKVNK